jgi:hypothetical protein
LRIISNSERFNVAYGTGFSSPDCELGVEFGLCCRLVGCEPAGSILNEYTLEILSLTGDLLVVVRAPYLKVIVALVIPEAVALYVMPERLGVSIGDCSPGFRVTCCVLHEAVVA